MRARLVIAGVLVAGVVGGAAAVALASGGGSSGALKEVRTATARFHSVVQAEKAGYEPFLECFDSPDGGMGQHLVNGSLIEDPAVDAARPEALVYEVNGDKLTLVGVEYIVPLPADPSAADAMRADPPKLFGRTFHEVPSLGVMVLHAWAWRDNPSGAFADWNPAVAACP